MSRKIETSEGTWHGTDITVKTVLSTCPGEGYTVEVKPAEILRDTEDEEAYNKLVEFCERHSGDEFDSVEDAAEFFSLYINGLDFGTREPITVINCDECLFESTCEKKTPNNCKMNGDTDA